MRRKQILTFFSTVILTAGVLSGCGSSSAAPSKASESEGAAKADTTRAVTEAAGNITKIKIAVSAIGTGVNGYLDENNNLTGSDVELLRKIDEKLPDYEFELIGTEMNDVLIGLQNGTYDGGIGTWLLTEGRIKDYKISDENLGVFDVGILRKKQYKDIDTLEKFAGAQGEKKLSFYDMQSGNGVTYIVEQYNKQHPDAQIKFNYTTEGTNLNGTSTGWVADGHFDFALLGRPTWEALVKAENGAYHDALNNLEWTAIQPAGTYPLFNKEKVSDEFIDEFDKALKELKEDGTASDLAVKFYGYNVYEQPIQNFINN